MAYKRIFNAKFGRHVSRNVLNLIREQQLEALAAAVEEDEEPPAPFVEFKRARPKEPRMPGCYCYKSNVPGIEEQEGGLSLESVAEWWIDIAVEGLDEEKVVDELETRVEAVDSIVRSAYHPYADADTRNTLSEGLPGEVFGMVQWSIERHVYGSNVARQTQNGVRHLRAATVVLRGKILEM